jgi:hypothetical protein
MQVQMATTIQLTDEQVREIEQMLERHRVLLERSARYRAYLEEAAEQSKVITDRAIRQLRASL